MTWLLKLLGVDPIGKIIGGLNDAYKARLAAQNDADRISADVTIEEYKTLLASAKEQAEVTKKAMDFKVFWIPWLLAAVPVATWFAWGMVDSMFNGALPDVAALPPQLKEYADVVWQNIFYTGVAGVGIQTLGRVLRR